MFSQDICIKSLSIGTSKGGGGRGMISAFAVLGVLGVGHIHQHDYNCAYQANPGEHGVFRLEYMLQCLAVAKCT